VLIAPNAYAGAPSYVYDDAGRLKAVIDPTGNTAIYNYDAVGNLLSITNQASSVLALIDFTPKSGPVGTTVTLYGTAFSATPASNTVEFNGTTPPSLQPR
jgi:YD repeat-containing protein